MPNMKPESLTAWIGDRTMTILRHGLSYSQANANCNRLASKAYDEAISSGRSVSEAQDAAFKAYNNEMTWYESRK